MSHPETETVRLTVAQAVVTYLQNQYVERDGVEQKFFAGCFGIFGHGNVAGMGEALQAAKDTFRYYICRNEQGMVHTAAAYAKVKDRMQTFACTTSIGPGATNMVTGAAAATINRVPVLLLPGDIFSRRNVNPVLQQVECEHSQDISVNDCFKPVSRYWDRINRPEQLITSLPECMRVLTSPSDTGAVTLCLPQDVQAEAFDFPKLLFKKRVWHITRPRADVGMIQRAADLIKSAKNPLIVAGGGTIYSGACGTLEKFVATRGIPSCETMAGKGALKYDNVRNLGAVGVTGTFGANRVALAADVVIGIGTRYQDFTTGSKTQFQNPDVKFVNINVMEFDAFKHYGVPLVGDAKATLEELDGLLGDYKAPAEHTANAEKLHHEWEAEVDKLYSTRLTPLLSQAEIIGLVNDGGDAEGIMVCAAGSLPGDLHKVWRARHPKNYHMEYGYSCMGYEIAGGLGIKMAAPEREVYVMVGDGSFLMLNAEIVTSVQEGYKLTIILLDNNGFKSIGALSRSLGQQGFGTRYVNPKPVGYLHGDEIERGETLPVDLGKIAEGMGAHVIRATTHDEFVAAMATAKTIEKTTVIYAQNDRLHGIGGYESWWDCEVAEVSTQPLVQEARKGWEEMRAKERYYL
eukprot:GFYU01014558.1.p1 GENE.GFYU01014558.1~~GFYU01014558.1.p1  ORF type:complete len:632 (-),score=190.55 GFYU01014558.1:403-2298(-)